MKYLNANMNWCSHSIAPNVPALGACGGLLAPKLNRNTTLNEPQQ